MEITPQELRDVEIGEAFRGYNREVVNDLLERAAATIEQGSERIREVTERLKAAQLEADRSRETEDILHRTLLLAQRAADEAVAEAQQKARSMLEEAELESHKLLADAQSDAQRRRDEERERLEGEVIDLAARRDTLLSDVDTLTQFESDYRERLAASIESDLDRVRNRDTSAPGPVPTPHDVELPASRGGVATTPESVDAPDTDDAIEATVVGEVGETAAGPEAPAPEAPAPEALGPPKPAAQFDTWTSRTGYVPPVSKPAPPADVPPAAEAEAEDQSASAPATYSPPFETEPPPASDTGPATQAVDMTALFDAEAEESQEGRWSPSPTSAYEAEVAPGTAAADDRPDLPRRADNTFDMLRPDALDAEVLDDDAFFATLREAVHDDSPLGPRDEGEDDGDFLGEDAERSSFRDVFRRRR
jgi:cell division septum initiation protein DivIVA